MELYSFVSCTIGTWLELSGHNQVCQHLEFCYVPVQWNRNEWNGTRIIAFHFVLLT